MTRTNESVRLTYSVVETAKVLGIGRNQCYNAIRRGDIRALSIRGSRLLVPKSEVERLLQGVSARA